MCSNDLPTRSITTRWTCRVTIKLQPHLASCHGASPGYLHWRDHSLAGLGTSQLAASSMYCNLVIAL